MNMDPSTASKLWNVSEDQLSTVIACNVSLYCTAWVEVSSILICEKLSLYSRLSQINRSGKCSLILIRHVKI
jgi:hypothetical protein